MNKMTNIITYPTECVSVSINKLADEVYRYASNPENLPAWTGFMKSVAKENNTWFAESDLGKIKIEFVSQNNFGIIDHWVTVPDGITIYNSMRVIENGQGSEFIFILFWRPNRTKEEFEQDIQAVKKDLKALKRILEKKPSVASSDDNT